MIIILLPLLTVALYFAWRRAGFKSVGFILGLIGVGLVATGEIYAYTCTGYFCGFGGLIVGLFGGLGCLVTSTIASLLKK